MTTTQVRASSAWLRLREPADARARAADLVEQLRPRLSEGSSLVHDLGSGSGSMARWLAGRLPGRQHWVLHDRDGELLEAATEDPPAESSDGSPVTLETRCHDVTRLGPDELAGASLVTASALLDMMTAAELDRFVSACAGAGCPVLVALSVTGEVRLTPEDPFDHEVAEAFNAHQRRTSEAGRLLGPDAVGVAVDGFARRGLDVEVRPSPWLLGADESALIREWFTGWLGAACEQRPDLRAEASSYARRRHAEAAAGRLVVTVGHQDVLARWP